MPSISSYPVCITRPQNSPKVRWLKMRNVLKTITLIPPLYDVDAPWPAENRVDIRGELENVTGIPNPTVKLKAMSFSSVKVDGVSWLARFGEINNEKINLLFISGCSLLAAPAMSATSGTLAPTGSP